MKINKLLPAILAIIAMALPLAAPAQNGTITPYSRFGYGMLRDNATSAQQSMGGVGYAMNSGRQINVMNPASYARIDSLTFLFDHKSVFKIKPKDGVSLEDLELELIDYGVDELVDDEDEEGNELVVLYGGFEDYSNIQKYLEENGFEIISSEFERIPNDLKEVTPEQRETLNKLLDKLEEDEDVQNVFHNMKEEE